MRVDEHTIGSLLEEAAAGVEPSDRLDRLIDARVARQQRERRVRTWVGAAAAAILVIGVAAVAFAGGGGDTDVVVGRLASTIDGTTHARLVVPVDTGVLAVDVDAGDARRVPVVGLPLGPASGPVGRAGHDLVVVKETAGIGNAYVVDVAAGRARLLGPASGTFAGPSGWSAWSGSTAPTASTVWLYESSAAGVTVREVELSGVTRQTYSLPVGHVPVAALGGSRLLVDRPSPVVGGYASQLVVWDGAAGREVSAYGPIAKVVDVRDGVLAWQPAAAGAGAGSSAPSPLRFTDLDTGESHDVAAPAGTAGFMGGGAYSPDGRTLAAFAMVKRGEQVDGVLVDVDPSGSRPPKVVAGSAFAIGETVGYASWSPDSSWVFFGQMGPRIGAYRVGTASAASVTLPESCHCYQQVVVERA